MKQPSAPTLKQKKIISEAGLNWHNWMVISDTSSLVIVHKVSGKHREIKKPL